MKIYQAFLTMADVIADLKVPGLDATFVERFLLPASQHVANTIGSFLPVIDTYKFGSRRSANNFVYGSRSPYSPARLFVTPGLLSVSALTNDAVSVAAGDYVLMPSGAHWQDGPYTWLEIAFSPAALHYWSADSEGVVITGRWGMYDRVETTGATLASAQGTVSVETLAVPDGSKLSPGMVVVIDDEMQFISGVDTDTASSATTLSASLDASTEIVSLTSGAAVKAGEVIRIDFERMKVLEVQSNSANVVRGWENTKKATHSSAATVYVYRQFKVVRGVNGSTAATHAQNAVISRQVVPADINYLTRQIAALMMKKADGAFGGRSGSPESGETFYIHEFPRDEIKRIQEAYYIPPAR